MDVIIAPMARSDIASILAWTEENFGPQTLKRYGSLIARGIEQVAENPELAGSRANGQNRRELPDLSSILQSKVIWADLGTEFAILDIFCFFTLTESNVVEIGRVLHDSMELSRIFRKNIVIRRSSDTSKQLAHAGGRRRLHSLLFFDLIEHFPCLFNTVEFDQGVDCASAIQMVFPSPGWDLSHNLPTRNEAFPSCFICTFSINSPPRSRKKTTFPGKWIFIFGGHFGFVGSQIRKAGKHGGDG